MAYRSNRWSSAASALVVLVLLMPQTAGAQLRPPVEKPCANMPGQPPEHFAYCTGNALVVIPLATQPLPVMLTYNSQVRPGLSVTSDRPDYGFGAGWVPNFESSIVVASSSSLILLRYDGGTETFTKRRGESFFRSDMFPKNPAKIFPPAGSGTCSGEYLLRLPTATGEKVFTYAIFGCPRNRTRWSIVKMTDHLGRGVAIERDTAGSVTGIRDGYGRAIQIERGSGISDVTIRDAVSRAYEIDIGSFGELAEIRLPDSSSWRLGYENCPSGAATCDFLLTKVEDPLGRVTTRTYTVDGTILSHEDERHSARFTYTSIETTVTSPGRSLTAVHNPQHAYVKLIENGVTKLELERGSYHRIESVTDTLGRSARYQYGRAGGSGLYPPPEAITVTKMTDYLGRETTFDYDREFRPTEIRFDSGRIVNRFQWRTTRYGGRDLTQLSEIRTSTSRGSTVEHKYSYTRDGYLEQVKQDGTEVLNLVRNSHGQIRGGDWPDGTSWLATPAEEAEVEQLQVGDIVTNISRTLLPDGALQLAMSGPGYSGEFKSDLLGMHTARTISGPLGGARTEAAQSTTATSITNARTVSHADLRSSTSTLRLSSVPAASAPRPFASGADACTITETCEQLDCGGGRCTRECNCCE